VERGNRLHVARTYKPRLPYSYGKDGGIGRSDLGGKQTWRPEAKRMTAAPKTESRTEVAVRVIATRRPGPNVGKAEVLEEETGRCTSGAAGVGVQASREGFAEIKSGRSQ